MPRSTTSFRIDDDLRHRLALAARAEGTSVTTLMERLLREGLAVMDHPGIVFKPGPSGRRAAVAGGPDVWEVASTLRRLSGTESRRVAAVAKEFGIHERQVMLALNYAAANRDEIGERIQANDLALAKAERIAEGRKRLLA